MEIITLDFETYFSKEYTIHKMTTEEYVRDPRFEIHGCAVRDGTTGTTQWHNKEDFYRLAAWWRATGAMQNKAILCHHTQFDGLILSHHFNIRPAFWLDTLSMARLQVGGHIRVGLDSLAKHFGLGAKNVPYQLFEGKRWDEVPLADKTAVVGGCAHDVELTWDLFTKLSEGFPPSELALIDETIRMFTYPILVGDTAKLGEVWEREEREKADLLAALDASGKAIRSDPVFAGMLRDAGVEPEMKPGKKGDIYAFAKTDQFMRDLLEHEDSHVVALAQARLAEKSNIEQTRAARLEGMSARGRMCVYLSYCGAHTTRWSGGDRCNWQNFPRDSDLGEAIRAPEGWMLVIVDASQIECRILNRLAGQNDVIERFRSGEDIYLNTASLFYGRQITRNDPAERGTGKQLELSCGYGAGAATIKRTAARGTYGPPVHMTDEDALRARDIYRETHPGVVQLWKQGTQILYAINGNNATSSYEWKCLSIRGRRIYLPGMAPLIYDGLEMHTDVLTGDQYWRMLHRGHYVKLYGAKLIENIVQALARLQVSEAWLRLREAGMRIVSMEHDKLIACVPEQDAAEALSLMHEAMCKEPSWMPELPLASEGYISHTFKKEGVK
jgi:DNA polymerase family A